MDATQQLTHLLPDLTATVRRIQVMQMNDPTPCSEFTVHGVLDHMMVLGATFTYQFRGEEPPAIEPPAVYGWVPAKEFGEVMDELLDAVQSPGALERTIATPVGDMPGAAFARFLAFDGLIHGWDLATATGQTYDPPADVVAAVDEFARVAITPDMRAAGMFAEPTEPPADAGQLERLVAFSGRTVREE